MTFSKLLYIGGFFAMLAFFSACSSALDQSKINPTDSTTTSNTAQNSGTISTVGSKGATNPTSSSGSSSPVQNAAAATLTGDNVMRVTVNGSLCGSPQYQYINEPCVSVTICGHGTSNCQTIDNILLDTGSSGLRLYKSVVTIPTIQAMIGGNKLAECISYTGNASEWGPVVYVDVKLANEPAQQVPIHIIDPTFIGAPAICSEPQTTPDTSPEESGFNGILGVGTWNQDCGPTCAVSAKNGMYYSCTSTGCSGTATTVQVQNPVALLPVDNNGIILEFPSVAAGGTTTLDGSLILGIGTQTNNTPGKVTTLTTDSNGLISTIYSAYSSTTKWTAFIDSGTPTLFVPQVSSMPTCNSNGSAEEGFFCPLTEQTATATNYNATGSISDNVTFLVGNTEVMFNSYNQVFGDLAQVLLPGPNNGTDGSFCWGLPFFFGRNVFSGIENTRSSLGVGPYYAY